MTGPNRPRRPSLAEIARGNSMFAPVTNALARAVSLAQQFEAREAEEKQAALDLAEHREASKRRLVERMAQELAAVDPERWTAEIDRLDKRYRRACRARWPDLTEDRLEQSSAKLWDAVLSRLDDVMAGARREAGSA
jgi:hypothetical protein